MRMRWLMVTTVRLGTCMRQASTWLIEDWTRMPKIVNCFLSTHCSVFTTEKSIITFYLPPTLPLSDADDTAHGELSRAWPLGSSDDLEDDDVDDVEDVEDLLWHLDELCERLDSVPSSRESKTGLVGKSILPSPLSLKTLKKFRSPHKYWNGSELGLPKLLSTGDRNKSVIDRFASISRTLVTRNPDEYNNVCIMNVLNNWTISNWRITLVDRITYSS